MESSAFAYTPLNNVGLAAFDDKIYVALSLENNDMYMIRLTKELQHEWTFKLVDPDTNLRAPINYVAVHQPSTGTPYIYFVGFEKDPQGKLRLRIAKANHDDTDVGCG